MFSSTTYFRILSIDPGSSTCGFSVLDCDLSRKHVNVIYSETITAKDVLVHKGPLLERFPEKTVKILGYADRLASFIAYFKPDIVISEAPYFKRLPQPYRVLSEQTFTFSKVVAEAAVPLDFILIEPSAVKLAMGVAGGSKDKEDMRRALERTSNLSYANDINLALLDEHAIDSICVGLWFYKRISD